VLGGIGVSGGRVRFGRCGEFPQRAELRDEASIGFHGGCNVRSGRSGDFRRQGQRLS